MGIGIIAALVLALGLGFGAEATEPGNVLYPIKTNVNEKIVSAVSLGAEAEGRWQARLTERRLEELEELTAEGRLSANAAARLKNAISVHADATASVSADADAEAQADIYSRLETALRVHEEILVKLSAEANEEARVHINDVIANLRAKIAENAQARTEAEAEVVASANTDVKVATEGKLRAAENKIREAQVFVSRYEARLSAEAKTNITAKLNAAATAVANGKARLAAGANGEAFVKFQEAFRLAQEAHLIATADMDLHIEIDIDMNDDDSATSSDDEDELEIEIEAEDDAGLYLNL